MSLVPIADFGTREIAERIRPWLYVGILGLVELSYLSSSALFVPAAVGNVETWLQTPLYTVLAADAEMHVPVPIALGTALSF